MFIYLWFVPLLYCLLTFYLDFWTLSWTLFFIFYSFWITLCYYENHSDGWNETPGELTIPGSFGWAGLLSLTWFVLAGLWASTWKGEAFDNAFDVHFSLSAFVQMSVNIWLARFCYFWSLERARPRAAILYSLGLTFDPIFEIGDWLLSFTIDHTPRPVKAVVWRLKLYIYRHYWAFQGRRRATYADLPNEIKDMILELATRDECLDYLGHIEKVVFDVIPGMAHADQYPPWQFLSTRPFIWFSNYYTPERIQHWNMRRRLARAYRPANTCLIRYHFNEWAPLISEGYALKMLLPEGSIPTNRDAGDPDVQNYVFGNRGITASPWMPGNKTFYYLYYISVTRARVYQILQAADIITGEVSGWNDLEAVAHLMHFLGTPSENLTNYQYRFNYIANLSEEDMLRVHLFVQRICRGLAFQHRRGPPPRNNSLSCLYHNNVLFAQDHVEILPNNIPWTSFVRSGAYEKCLQQWILNMSFGSLHAFCCGIITPPRALNIPHLRWMEQLARGRGWLTPSLSATNPGHITLTPNWVAQDALPPTGSMEEFVATHSYRAWEAARALPRGEPLRVDNLLNPLGGAVNARLTFDVPIQDVYGWPA